MYTNSTTKLMSTFPSIEQWLKFPFYFQRSSPGTSNFSWRSETFLVESFSDYSPVANERETDAFDTLPLTLFMIPHYLYITLLFTRFSPHPRAPNTSFTLVPCSFLHVSFLGVGMRRPTVPRVATLPFQNVILTGLSICKIHPHSLD